MHASRLFALVTGLVLAGSLGACGSGSSDSSGGTTYAVDSGDKTCDVDKTELPPGPATFTVTNSGSDVTEVYIYAEKNGQFTDVVDEVENVTPGTTGDLDVDLDAGRYNVTCKPGMSGDGISTLITVKSGASAS